MYFQQILATLPPIDKIHQINILNTQGELIHSIPAIPGKLGSLRIYNALAQKFAGKLNPESAKQGLIWFAEHCEEARKQPNSHPNIDLLFMVIEQNQQWEIQVVTHELFS